MLKNYLKIAWRQVRKRPGYSSLNVAGLALGLACAMLIGLYVRHEWSYDRFHTQSDRIVRVLTLDRSAGVTSQRVGITMPMLGPAAVEALPEVVGAVRMNGNGRTLFTRDDRSLYSDAVLLASPSVFEVFDGVEVLRGDAATALEEPATLVLTASFARRLFGDADAVGQTLTVDSGNDATVVGVVADPPAASHLAFDALISLHAPPGQDGWRQWLESWNSISMITYLLLDDASVVEDAAARAAFDARLVEVLRANDVPESFAVTAQPLRDVHLGSSDVLFDTNASKSDAGYVNALGAVAVLVLLIAAFNFMNLATARSAERAREVGVRKVMGAGRRSLVGQYLGEALVLCLVAFALALALVALALPRVGDVLGAPLALDVVAEPELVAYGVLLFAGLALAAGFYPALVLARFRPVTVLQGDFKTSAQGAMLRKVLVVSQFTASVAMIGSALVVSGQLDYIMARDMGFDRDRVVSVPLTDPVLGEGSAALREALLGLPQVAAVGRLNALPGQTLPRGGFRPEGQPEEEDPWILNVMSVDAYALDALGIEMAAGRGYLEDFGADTLQSVLLNEAAARALGWEAPVGRTLQAGEEERTVVGVVRDFHFASVRHAIEPVVFFYQPGPNSALAVKLQDDTADALAAVEDAWRAQFPTHPFDYAFLDDQFAEQYRTEALFARLAQAFTGLAIVIACLGLFGLAAFTAQQRTKEIGVRKVLGASVPQVVVLLARDFVALVAVAVIVAIPVTYLVMRRWLADFAYRVDLGPGVFLAAAALALGIAVLTVSYQSVRAATIDPVKALRYE